MNERYELYMGDCLEVMKQIPGGSVDLVLTDPPYGTIKGINESKASKDCGYRACDWDESIKPSDIFNNCARVLRQNGKAILFSQEPYTSQLITEQEARLPFSYRAIWLKNSPGNILGCCSAMVGLYEDICIFKKSRENKTGHPLMRVMQDELAKRQKTKEDAFAAVGSSASHYFTNGIQFRIPTAEKHRALVEAGVLSIEYDVLKEADAKYKSEYPAVFNLWQGGKTKSNVLEYAKDRDGFHPTQKPVALLEDLIQTFSNPGDTILDFTMGSGSTGVACANTGRKFIGIELDHGYYEIARERVEGAAQANA